MSNFTISWKFLEKLEKAGKLGQGKLDEGELEAERGPARGKLEAARRAGKFCKIFYKLEIYISWKELDIN